MAGLLNGAPVAPDGASMSAAPSDPAAMEAGMAPATPEDEGQDPDALQATPEEEAANEEFVARALLVIYDKGYFPKLLDMLDDGQPKEAIAQAAASIVKRVYDAATGSGDEVSGDVVLNAAKEIYEELADTASKFGMIDFDADPDAFEGGYYLMMDQLRLMAQESGELDMESVNADFAEMSAQDRAAGGEGMPLPGQGTPRPGPAMPPPAAAAAAAPRQGLM